MSDGTGTMSVQLVLCVADSVWRAAGHLARLCMCRRGTRIAPAAHMLLFCRWLCSYSTAVLRCCCCCWLCSHATAVAIAISSGTTETAAGDGVGVLLCCRGRLGG